MKIDPVKYYYKDLTTNIEMEFTKSEEWGWAVEFKNCSVDQMLNYRGHVEKRLYTSHWLCLKIMFVHGV